VPKEQKLEDSSYVVIMAGGQSRRFGSNKAFAKFMGKTFLERVIHAVSQVTERFVLSVRDQSDYPWLKVDKVPDLVKGVGPMGGLYSCFKVLKAETLLLVACDMPLLSSRFIRFMLEFQCEEPIVVPEAGGQLHPLHARYHKSVVQYIEELIEENRFGMSELLRKVPFKTISQIDAGNHVDLEKVLTNVNTRLELEMLQKHVNR